MLRSIITPRPCARTYSDRCSCGSRRLLSKSSAAYLCRSLSGRINVQVQIATEAAGKSPEEVERFVTIPIEIAMTGLPGMTDMRSLNKPGLSLLTLVFTDESDLFRERQMISERMSELRERMPEGVTPVLGPITNALGEVYQYTLEMPGEDTSKHALSRDELMKRRTLQDWVVRPLLRSIPQVAEIDHPGGFVKQYETFGRSPEAPLLQLNNSMTCEAATGRNNANAGGRRSATTMRNST